MYFYRSIWEKELFKSPIVTRTDIVYPSLSSSHILTSLKDHFLHFHRKMLSNGIFD